MTEARFLSDKPRHKTIELDWPVGLGDTEYRTVVVRRLTTAEVDAFVAKLRDMPEGSSIRFPIYFDEAGTAIPDEVWEVLDTDDRDRLSEAADAFLPARWKRAATEMSQSPSTSTPPTSDTGDSSSAESPPAAATQAT